MAKQLPPQDELKIVFDYDHASGLLMWKARADRSPQWNGRHAGKPALSIGRGNRVVVNYQKQLYLAHRLIWKLITGNDPVVDIDHKDGDTTNNRYSNLREATKHQNLRNSKLHRGKLLPKGVSAHKGRYRTGIYLNERCTHLGVFDTADAAHAAYRAAALRHFGEFARFS